MANQDRLLMECGTLNRVFAAFFINECEKNKIDFIESKPQREDIAQLNNGQWFLSEKDSPPGLKTFFDGKVLLENVDMNKFKTTGIYDFFDDEMKSKLIDCSNHFANEIEKAKYCDLIFSALPDYPPFIYDCIMDPETNFKSRLVIGHDITTNNYNMVWDFYCILVSKFREVDPHPIYGKHFRNVDGLTDEERKKFNKKMETE
jgi:hypothetical protein